MSSETNSEPIISLTNVGKCYQVYRKPHHRLLQMLMRGRRKYSTEFRALNDINLHIIPGEVIGIMGSNGAGKSTLLQLVCGTLTPSHGQIKVNGRIAALLELGAGFNSEFTGRENIYLSATIAGMSKKEIDAAFDSIVEFSGISNFIDQPVKTYSSGMYVRLAFSVAINVEPDILVIDEALSVGDGEFARKSFNRIMQLKEAGTTILFCSHALYQIEALCNRAFWLENGNIRAQGETRHVISSYSSELSAKTTAHLLVDSAEKEQPRAKVEGQVVHFHSTTVFVNGIPFNEGPSLVSQQDCLTVRIEFESSPSIPVPQVGVLLTDSNRTNITSAGTHIDGFQITRDPEGNSVVNIQFPSFPLLKGEYDLDVFLLCERGIHAYEHVQKIARLSVRQNDLTQGYVAIPHLWSNELKA